MELFLYCSYTHSRRGFVLTRLKGNELVPASLIDAQGGGEKILERFFSYDVFRILWQEFSDYSRIPLLPGTGGAIFGIRGLKGKISDREGVINFAILANKNEIQQLEKMAAGILSDPDGFGLALSRCLFVGGICGYQADIGRLRELLQSIRREDVPEAFQSAWENKGIAYSVRNQLRFAVYVGTWEQVVTYMQPQWLWKSCPKQAYDQEKFAKLLGRNIWE